MERIILPMKVHAVKLDYRRRLLETMVHGYFGVRKVTARRELCGEF